MTNSTAVYIFYESTNVLESMEVVVIDEFAMLSMIGGSLGLFLGFSCLQLAQLAFGASD